MAADTTELIRWEPAELNAKSVAFSLNGILVPDHNAWKLGTFSVEGTKDNALVTILPAQPESTDTTLRVRLWQRAVDRIERAAHGLPYDFTCFT